MSSESQSSFGRAIQEMEVKYREIERKEQAAKRQQQGNKKKANSTKSSPTDTVQPKHKSRNSDSSDSNVTSSEDESNDETATTLSETVAVAAVGGATRSHEGGTAEISGSDGSDDEDNDASDTVAASESSDSEEDAVASSDDEDDEAVASSDDEDDEAVASSDDDSGEGSQAEEADEDEDEDEEYNASGQDEGAEDAEDEEYFQYDSSLFKTIVVSHLMKKYGHLGLTREQLGQAVEKSLQQAGEEIIDEYSGNKPADKRWRIGLSDQQIQQLEPELQHLRKELEAEMPTMENILQATLPKQEKKKCIELYDILQNMEPYTHRHLETRLEIAGILRKQHRYTKDEVEEMDRKEESMKDQVAADDCLKRKIFALDCEETTRNIIYEKYLRLLKMDSSDSNYGNALEWLERAVSLPYRRAVQPRFNFSVGTNEDVNRSFAEFYQILDTNLYGLKRVKQEICQIANERAVNPHGAKAILALKSSPGQGKTKIAKVTADALGVPFERISCGGMTDPTIIKGSKRDWIGSAPSIILQILERAKYCNGIILIDEMDKLGKSGGGGGDSNSRMVQYAFLHILDYTQNNDFRDSFLSEYGHDLSKIWFWIAVNDDTWLDPTLRDRLYIVNIPAYTYTEKLEITQKYVLPETLKNSSLTSEQVQLSKDGAIRLLTLLQRQIEKMGIRPIEREMQSIVSRINFLRRVTLTDGTTGSLKLDYKIPNFDVTFEKPLILTASIIDLLWSHETPVEAWRDLYN